MEGAQVRFLLESDTLGYCESCHGAVYRTQDYILFEGKIWHYTCHL